MNEQRHHTDLCNARSEGPYLQPHPITGDDCWCHDDEALVAHSEPHRLPQWLQRMQAGQVTGKDLTGSVAA